MEADVYWWDKSGNYVECWSLDVVLNFSVETVDTNGTGCWMIIIEQPIILYKIGII
jgi:hypothetical protein